MCLGRATGVSSCDGADAVHSVGAVEEPKHRKGEEQASMIMAMTRKIALGLGVIYLGLGVLGFVPGAPIGGLAVDPTHSLAHLFVGLIALWGSQAVGTR